ncbi:MAG: hypothetical protein KF721_02420 [Ignavibacteriaceae bacterium]|nr:hypothetical protein [Ignavibacteriaceae bacterium]
MRKLILIFVSIFVFWGCEKDEIVSVSDENSHYFYLSFKAEENYAGSQIVGTVIRVEFNTDNTIEAPLIILKSDTVKTTFIDSTRRTVRCFWTIKDTTIISFQIVKNEKVTKGVFVMPEIVRNLTCNGFIFRPLLELEDSPINYQIPESSDSMYIFKWDQNADGYHILVNSSVADGEYDYSGNDTQFAIHSKQLYPAGKPLFIYATSLRGSKLTPESTPTVVGTYGSGFVVGSRSLSYRYEP